jgi:hypothetical protein
MTLRGLVLAVLLAACGDQTVKHAGESCTSSAECDKGLLCDLGVHKCAGMSSQDAAVETVDGPPGVDARPIDARPVDAAIDAI